MRFFYHPTAVSSMICTMLLFLGWISEVAKAQQEEFEPVTGTVPQDTTSVSLPPDCPENGKKVPNTMFTFVPVTSSNETKILSYPKDLIIAEAVGDDGGGGMKLTWNLDVVSDATNTGGVRLEYPAGQLKRVGVRASSQAQILDGFTSFEDIEVSSSAKLWATLTTTTTSLKKVATSSSAKAYIKATGALLDRVEVSSSGSLDLEADTVTNIKCSSSGTLKINGNVGAGQISSSGKVTIDGDLQGVVKASSSGTLKITGEITGEGRVEASSSAKVTSSNCEKVSLSSGAKCDAGNVEEVSVDVSEQPFTLEGTNKCHGSWSGTNTRYAPATMVLLGAAGFGFLPLTSIF